MKRIILVLLVAACFGQNGLHDFAPSLGRGLNVNVVGGVAAISTVPTAIAGTSVGVAANTTTYIYVDLSAAIISSNTSGFTSTEYPVATVVTNSTQIVTLTDDRPGAYAVSGGGGSGTVSSVSNSDGTLTITPTTGAVIAALALAHANTWTGQQTFVAPILGTPASGIITNLTGTCTSCTSNLAVNISTNGTANQVWGMNSGATAQGWQTVSAAGANTGLSNLAATTALNSPLLEGTGNVEYGFTASSNFGVGFNAANGGSLTLSNASGVNYAISGNEGLTIASAWPIAWTNGAALTGTLDTAINRGAAGVLCSGTSGAVPDCSGIFEARGFTLAGSSSGTFPLSANSTGSQLNLGPDANVTSAGALTVTSCTGCGGGVTSIATTSPITGGTITTTGTIACATCVTSAASLTSTAIMTGAGSQASQTPDTTATLSSGGVLAGVSMAENLLTGAAAAGTITEGGSTFSVTRAGVSTANLTAPWVFQNTNSTNNNTSITLGITSPGTSTGQTTLNINGATTGGDLTDWGTGGTWTAGVLSGQTNVAKVGITGGFTGLNFTGNGTTAGFIDFAQGSTSAAVAPCNTTNSICDQAPTAVTAGVRTLPPALAQGVLTNVGSSSALQQGYSGDAGHSTTVTISSATSVGSTSLCSTTICPAGTYQINGYLDVTTACSTTGGYFVSIIFTDDAGSKTVVMPLIGTGVTASLLTSTGISSSLALSSTSNFAQGDLFIRSTGAASINYSTTASACATGGPAAGKLYLSVIPVQ